MNWYKSALSDGTRLKRNVARYIELRNKIDKIIDLAFFTQSISHELLLKLSEDQLVQANDVIKAKIEYLLQGENNQKVMVDSPHRAKEVLSEIIVLIDDKVRRLQNELKEM